MSDSTSQGVGFFILEDAKVASLATNARMSEKSSFRRCSPIKHNTVPFYFKLLVNLNAKPYCQNMAFKPQVSAWRLQKNSISSQIYRRHRLTNSRVFTQEQGILHWSIQCILICKNEQCQLSLTYHSISIITMFSMKTFF